MARTILLVIVFLFPRKLAMPIATPQSRPFCRQIERTAIYPVNRASHDKRHRDRFCRAAEALLSPKSPVDEIPIGSEL